MAKSAKTTAKKEVETVKDATNESTTKLEQSTEIAGTEEVKYETSNQPDTETNGNSETTNQEDLEETQQLQFVIPYLKGSAAGNELKYALRSIHASFPDAVLIVVGDKEDWFSEDVIHLEHTPESDNPQIDVAHKLLLVLASGVLTNDYFILSNDDIFLLGETDTQDIFFHKAFGELNSGVGQRGGRYNKNAENTLKALQADQLPIHRFGTHTPVALYRKELSETIGKYKADEEGHLITSLYFNSHYPGIRPVQVDGGKNDPILVSVYRSDVPVEVLEDVLVKRKFCNVNDAGWKAVEPHLSKAYPNKSKWEI